MLIKGLVLTLYLKPPSDSDLASMEMMFRETVKINPWQKNSWRWWHQVENFPTVWVTFRAL